MKAVLTNGNVLGPQVILSGPFLKMGQAIIDSNVVLYVLLKDDGVRSLGKY